MTVKSLTIFSNALRSRKTCYIYLPPSYEHSEQSYPVIYLLHGSHGSELNWIEFGQADVTLDQVIGATELRECIVVMPNDGEYAHGTYYANWYVGSGSFEHYIIDDLVPQIDEA